MKIVIDERITGCEWYKNKNTKILFLHALLKAYQKEKEWQGVKIKQGQFISSYANLSAETGLTISEIRTALRKLINNEEIKHEPHSKFALFTVLKYDEFIN